MSNIGSRFKKLIMEPKVTVKKISHKFKYDRKGAFQLISSEIRGDSKRIYQKVRKHLPIKYHGKHNFTIVSACYNVDKYLNEYFKSIINQSLDFKKHIQIICVDDGSSDNTAAIIKQWQEKYPNNIHYIYKENGGQASARNLGLESVQTEWVTFIDPDDFLSDNYFFNVNNEITESTKMLICNLIFWIENEKLLKDTHPLKYRFNNRTRRLAIQDLKDCINLSAASTFFKMDSIKKNNLLFDDRIKPTFEDGKFIADYMLMQNTGEVVFVKESQYLYRKRDDGDSTLDTAWKKEEKYYNVLVYGYVKMLKEYHERRGFVPEHIQRTVIYDIVWYLKYLLDQPGKIAFLSEDKKEIFYKLLIEIFQYIEIKCILQFNLAGIWWLHKAIMIAGLKGAELPNYFAYIETIDQEKKEMLISFFVSPKDHLENINIGGEDIIPRWSKTLKHKLADRVVIYERRIWVSYDGIENNILNLFVDDKIVSLNLKGKWYKNGIIINSIINTLKPSSKYSIENNNTWIIMDRDMQADDNGEHLYRYLKESYPEDNNIYFALSSKSHDWNRLKNEGFNLLDFGTTEFEKVLCKSSKVISSHADDYIHNYFQDNYENSKKMVFLQHGITKDDLSTWLNKKRNLHCFITATTAEYDSIAGRNSPYKYSSRDTFLTGFPRHDALLRGNEKSSKQILIMPTWRDYIAGKIIQGSFRREKNKSFANSIYYKAWSNFLNSQELKGLVEKHGFNIVFAPHANIEPYLEDFIIPEYIQVWHARDGKIQDLFRHSKLMITDYSSVAFEMAYLEKTVIYYQFDKDLVFGGGHTTQKGYFSYEDDGFGPVVDDLNELLIQLDKSLTHNGEPLEPYKTRINATFPFRDGLNCERVYQAIKSLDAPEEKVIDLDILQDYTISAYENARWDLLISRCNLLEKYGDNVQQQKANYMKSLALIETYQFDEVDFDVLSSSNRIQLQARQAFLQEEWQKTIDYLTMSEFKLDREQLFMLLRCYAELKRSSDFSKLSSKLIELTENEKLILQSWDACGKGDWFTVIDLLKDKVMGFSQDELSKYKPQLLLSSAFRQIGQYSESHNQLVDYEKHINNDASCRIEIARLAFIQENYGKVITQLERASRGFIINLPEKVLIEFLVSLEKTEQTHKVSYLLNEIMDKRSSAINALFFILIRRQNWKKIIELAEPLYSNLSKEVVYPLILAKMRMGLIDDAYKLYIKPTSDFPYEYWEIISDLAVLKNNSELASFCFQNMITLFPDRNKESNLQKLISLSR